MNKQTKFFANGLVLLFIISFCSIQAMGQWRGISGSGNVVSETRTITNFDQITVGGAFDLFVTIGDRYHVEVVADDNLMERIQIEVIGKTLRIGTTPGTNLRRYTDLEVHVTLPVIRELKTSGAATAVFTNAVRQNGLTLSSSGASDIRLSVEADELYVSTSGSSDVHISGFAAFVEVSASGASDFRGQDFECAVASVRLSGSSDMSAVITQKVSGSLSGSSDLRILGGNPEIDVRTSGSSGVRQSGR
jgi:hypothetical protein